MFITQAFKYPFGDVSLLAVDQLSLADAIEEDLNVLEDGPGTFGSGGNVLAKNHRPCNRIRHLSTSPEIIVLAWETGRVYHADLVPVEWQLRSRVGWSWLLEEIVGKNS